MRFRKRPEEIEAFEYDGDLVKSDGRWYVPTWARDAYKNGTLFYESLSGSPDDPPTELYLHTSTCGKIRVAVGDYVVRSPEGELFVCSPEIFLRIYEYCGV